MKRTIAIAIALALSLSTSFALAGDAAEPTELKTKEPIKQALAAPDGSLLLLEGEITQYARRVAGKDAPKIEKGRILVWDLAKNEEASALTDIPDGATHMAVSGSRLLVACGENGLAVVDLKTKAVKKIATASFKPYQVCTDAAPGKALIFATGSPSGTTHSSINDRMLIEVDLETQKTTLLMDRPFGDYALVAKNMLVVQGEFTSGPCATPRFHSLPECRKPADNKYAGVVGGVQASARTNEGGGRGWHQDWGMWRVVNGGANIVATEDFEQRILCMPSDCNKVVWTVPGDLYSVYPSKPLLLAFKSEGKEKNARADGPRSSPKEQWKLVGLHSANGKQVFSTTITFDFKASLGSRGDQVNFCQTIVSTKDGDKLVFAVRESGSGGGAGGRKGKNAAAASEKVVWLSADLPKVDLSAVPILEGEPAPTVRLTETYTFSPKVTNGDKAKFSLKSGPDGVKVDETTARVTWRPTDKQIGKHDIEVLAKVGADEFTVLSFEVKVTTADEFVAKELDLGELQAGRIIASEDGASLFILEAKVQGQPAPASRVIVWDVAKKAIEKSINVPKSPEHMVLVQGKLVVTCPESQVVAIVDTKEKKVTKSVEVKIDGKELTPRAVFKDSPAGKVIVTCGGEDRGGFDAQTVEIGLADGSVKPLYFGMSRGAAHVAVAKDYVAWTDGSWGSVTKLSELRKAPKKGENKG
ncbi:MAG: hypothetical protein ACAI25_03555, partial [Planctomycetota bacterium]